MERQRDCRQSRLAVAGRSQRRQTHRRRVIERRDVIFDEARSVQDRRVRIAREFSFQRSHGLSPLLEPCAGERFEDRMRRAKLSARQHQTGAEQCDARERAETGDLQSGKTRERCDDDHKEARHEQMHPDERRGQRRDDLDRGRRGEGNARCPFEWRERRPSQQDGEHRQDGHRQERRENRPVEAGRPAERASPARDEEQLRNGGREKHRDDRTVHDQIAHPVVPAQFRQCQMRDRQTADHHRQHVVGPRESDDAGNEERAIPPPAALAGAKKSVDAEGREQHAERVRPRASGHANCGG